MNVVVLPGKGGQWLPSSGWVIELTQGNSQTDPHPTSFQGYRADVNPIGKRGGSSFSWGEPGAERRRKPSLQRNEGRAAGIRGGLLLLETTPPTSGLRKGAG